MFIKLGLYKNNLQNRLINIIFQRVFKKDI